MTTQYITLQRVKDVMPRSYDGSDDAALSEVLTSCCAFLDQHCNVANGGFISATYDELYHGTGDHILFLNQRPVQSISRIATTTLPAISIQNTTADQGVRALVKINGTTNSQNLNTSSQQTSTGITLTYIQSGVTTTTTLTWVSYPTVSQLAAAINAVGLNWTATVQGGFGTWSTTDLRATQGNFGARITTTYLWIHWFDLPIYRINEANGEVWSPQGFERGVFNWRVTYTAGFATFPDDLTQALAELTAGTYFARVVNPNTQSQSIGPGYSYAQATKKGFEGLSVMAKKTIGAYRRYPTHHFSTW